MAGLCGWNGSAARVAQQVNQQTGAKRRVKRWPSWAQKQSFEQQWAMQVGKTIPRNGTVSSFEPERPKEVPYVLRILGKVGEDT